MLNKIIIILLLVLTFNFVHAQERHSSELQSVQNSYAKIKDISFEVEVYGYESPTDRTPELVGKGLTSKGSGYSYSKFAETECLQKKNLTLFVNHAHKIINYYEYASVKTSPDGFPGMSPDSLLKYYDSIIVYKGVENGSKHFTMSTPDADIIQTELYFDQESNLLNKVVYYYASSDEDQQSEYSTVIIYYKNYNITNHQRAKVDFSKYINKSAKGYVASVHYQGYKLQYFDFTKKQNY